MDDDVPDEVLAEFAESLEEDADGLLDDYLAAFAEEDDDPDAAGVI